MIRCIGCNVAFEEGDMLQMFLRSPDDPEGSWSKPVEVDAGFQERCQRHDNENGFGGKRKHAHCGHPYVEPTKAIMDGVSFELLGKYDSPVKYDRDAEAYRISFWFHNVKQNYHMQFPKNAGKAEVLSTLKGIIELMEKE